jgi:single-strand DNA-binding protein
MKVHDVVRLTKDPEIRYNPAGTAFVNFDVAWSTGSGDNKKSHFIRCIAAGKSAENIAKFFVKGQEINIKCGELQQNNWETQDGQKRSRHEIFIEQWGFCGNNNNNKDKNDNLDKPPADDAIDLSDLPF